MQSSSDTKAPLAIAKHFASLKDPRVDRTKLHPLLNVIVIALLGVTCGAEGWDDLQDWGEAKRSWLATFLDMPNGVPKADTFRRVFEALRPAAFATCMSAWIKGLAAPLGGQVVAFDGKALRGALARSFERTSLHMVHAWACEQRLLLGIEQVEGAPEEGAAIRRLLETLELREAIVTVDAGNASKANVDAIIEHDADYVVTIKGNRAAAHATLQAFFKDAEAKAFEGVAVRKQTTTERGHGRHELRQIWVVAASVLPTLQTRWTGLRSVVMVRRTRVHGDGRVEVETHYYASSLAPRVRLIAKAIRTHWGVENGLHWILDVQLREDSCPIRHEAGAANFALLRRIAVMLLKRDTTSKRGVRAKQKNAGWDHDFLLHVITCGMP